MGKLQIALFVAIFVIAYASARPRMDYDDKRITKHDRTSVKRRHTDVKLIAHILKIKNQRQQLLALRRNINALGTGRISRASRRRARAILIQYYKRTHGSG